MDHMTLGELIKKLESCNKEKIIKRGFKNPHSYRGYYYELAFEPACNISIQDMLNCAKDAVNNTYVGWKGGDFIMTENTSVYISFEGDTGEELTTLLLAYLLEEDFPEPDFSLWGGNRR